MSSTTRIPEAEIPEADIAGLLLNGELPEPAGVMWHNRAVLSSMFAFGREAEKWDELDSNLKSFAAMAADALVGCSWCLDLGYFQAHNAGLDVAKASEVPRWRESTCSGRSSAM
jgi:alkylhydroperoxidase family enzyme